MRDYRTYKELYKMVGFFTIIFAVALLAYKATSWVLWARQYVDANLV